jgi:hypothetical protein
MRRAELIATPAEDVPLGRFSVVPRPTHQSEARMFATIRRYTLKDPSKGRDAIAGLKPRIEKNFAPRLHDVPGFHSYYVVNSSDRELITISIFETRDGAEESTRRASEFVRNDPLKDQLQGLEVIEGELILSKEAPVGTH